MLEPKLESKRWWLAPIDLWETAKHAFFLALAGGGLAVVKIVEDGYLPGISQSTFRGIIEFGLVSIAVKLFRQWATVTKSS